MGKWKKMKKMMKIMKKDDENGQDRVSEDVQKKMENLIEYPVKQKMIELDKIKIMRNQ